MSVRSASPLGVSRRPPEDLKTEYLKVAALCGAGLFLLIAVVMTGWLRAADDGLAVAAAHGLPCWAISGSQATSVLVAAELSLVYAALLAAYCARQRRPLAGLAIVGLMLATVGVEFVSKRTVYQPAPSASLLALERPECFRVAYPLTSVPTSVAPNSLPSGYVTRTAYFGVVLAALIGARWPRLTLSARLVLSLVVVVLAFTRVAVSWHWTSDVIAGLLLGGAAGCLALAVANGFAWVDPRSLR